MEASIAITGPLDIQLQIRQEFVGGFGLVSDSVERTDCYLSVKGYNTPNLAVAAVFFSTTWLPLSDLYEPESLQSTNRLMP